MITKSTLFGALFKHSSIAWEQERQSDKQGLPSLVLVFYVHEIAYKQPVTETSLNSTNLGLAASQTTVITAGKMI